MGSSIRLWEIERSTIIRTSRSARSDGARSEIMLGQQAIVGGAKQPQIIDVFPASTRPWPLVVNLQKRPRRAATTVRAAISALQAVSLRNLTQHGVRDVIALARGGAQRPPLR